MSIGLVLSGGGAKGAYQVGVLKALAEFGIEIDKVSGASIGALNGVLVASSKSTQEAADKLEQIWLKLAKVSPIKLDEKNISYLLGVALVGLMSHAPNPLFKSIEKVASLGLALIGKRLGREIALCDDSPIQSLFDEYLDLESWREWKDVWVSVFEGGISDSLIEFVKGEFLRLDTRESIFIELKSLGSPEFVKAILASAALPILYPAKHLAHEDGYGFYFDGGIGGAKKSQGNTPITPLQNICDTIIVTHLDNGSLFDRRDFKGTIIDIRPQKSMITSSNSNLKAMLDFDEVKIDYLIQCGYEDTLRTMNEIADFSNTRSTLSSSQHKMNKLLDQL